MDFLFESIGTFLIEDCDPPSPLLVKCRFKAHYVKDVVKNYSALPRGYYYAITKYCVHQLAEEDAVRLMRVVATLSKEEKEREMELLPVEPCFFGDEE